MENIHNIKHLIDKVAVISGKYADLAKKTGENFNIFSVMGMEKNERYTHSAIIGELLNPKGSHGQGSVFLKLFFNEIEVLTKLRDFDFEKAKIIIEQHLGPINTDCTKGGFIDIVIKDQKNAVIIENKIHAPDQKNQLIRYKNHYPDGTALYLNLFGEQPSEGSTGNLIPSKDFHIIDYQSDIKNWLEKCHKETVEQPILRETIKQYLNTIKKLTNQSLNNDMSEEIINLIRKDLKSAGEISNNFRLAKESILTPVRMGVIERLVERYSEKYEITAQLPISNSNASIAVKQKQFFHHSAFFCMVTFSGNLSSENLLGKDLFIGILDYGKKSERFFLEEKQQTNIEQKGWWWATQKIENFEGFAIDFSDLDFLQFLASHPEKTTLLVGHIAKYAIQYIEDHEAMLTKIQNKIVTDKATL